MTDKVIINTDGASRGNPGPSAVGITIKSAGGTMLKSISRLVGRMTNNQAEYRAVIISLEEAVRLGAKQVILYSDSELVVKQLTGKYRVKKEALKPLYRQAISLIEELKHCRIKHIMRSKNKEADRLANEAF